MERQEVDLVIVLFGTTGMLVLALALVLFAVLYKKRITAKKLEISKMEQEYQLELLRSTIQAKEKEQFRIARELHDDVGSSLTAIKLHLNKYDLQPKVMKELGENLRELIVKIREISDELHPSVLEELGLSNAIRNLCRKLNDQTDVDCTYEYEQEKEASIPRDVELALYRVVQELFNNILKHAEANQVKVFFLQKSDQLKLVIEDDGNGFIPTPKHRQQNSHGLKNIDSRIQQIGATLTHQVDTTQGTKVTITQNL